MIAFPNAKINLGLFVTEKRNDGYHNIESVFYPIGLSDMLEIVPDQANGTGQISFQSTGIEIPGSNEENLCVKAYHLIGKDKELPSVKVHLHKIIPIGAGLGGGSANCAFFINLLNEVFELNMSLNQRKAYAAQLGSDCNFFIQNKPAFVSGRGENVDPIQLDLSDYLLVLVNTGIHVSTGEAYSGMEPQPAKINLRELIQQSPENWEGIANDFEKTVFSKYPEIGAIKQKLGDLGAVYTSMSGSGSSVYAIFKNQIDLSDHFQDYFVWQGSL